MMFKERPAFGYGPSTFPDLVISYAGRVPTAVLKPALAPHNLYAEFAATSGVNGLLGWAVVIFGFMGIAVLGIVAHPTSRDRIFAAAVLGAIVAWSAASVGLHLSYFRTFGLVLALVPAVAPEWPIPKTAIRTLLRAIVIRSAAVLAGVFVTWLALSATSVTAHTASQRVTLMPVGDLDGWYAYALDIRSRPELLSTFAELLQDPSSKTSIVADPVRGILTFSADEDTAEHARDEVQRAVGYADSMLHNSIGYQQYALQTVGSMDIVPANDRSPLATLSAAAMGALAAVLVGVMTPRILARRRRDRPLNPTSTQELTPV